MPAIRPPRLDMRMRPHRRQFLAGAAALAVVPAAARAAVEPETLTARPARMQLVPGDYPETEIWGYDGRVPGPVIRAAQGGRVSLRFVNDLPQGSSVHWHGLRIDNAMDGVSGLTQEAVPGGSGFDYDFTAPDAGTFWYHAHNRSVEQVARGLYGALIVDEPEAPDVDRDEVLVLDDWLLDPETVQVFNGFDAPHERSHAGRRGNFITTNGQSGLSLAVRRNERLRLRLVNAANARVFRLGLSGLAGWVVALDGMPLAAPEEFGDTLFLGPGQRADLFVDVTAESGSEAHLVAFEDGEGLSQVAFRVESSAAGRSRPAPAALPPNPNMEVAGLEDARRLRLLIEGGAMGRMEAAVLDGARKSFRELIDENQFWAFNGVVGMTETPLAALALGETARLDITNDTAFPHAMHLHGMHFREVSADGGLGPLRDTSLLFGGERREIAFAAHNPGKWLFHCHMLSHAASGMSTWIEVT